uniref:Uncharacterized protein n=1 Tax=Haptolina ericina TaxID=156174 RepID=A0A7S3AIZ4_9EUKA|mmetsp:Transcript_21487/g.48413  ORF Transcript_21487/g.48413 Transcript_21487/m.48413 type:complete len:172 (+) Transcript_21487:36-551(+)|eukprot:CAMPEP_0181173174 /NCGR_PEP_ID=MMETSP1096-20121128/2854_1 /TAXON_ID=156174 ORGANISM="Chrysochromulina ericina, Strain CCMP281" /NCGR_SAMPLE_ID=MMETSP1096 /ASSEMBLY_ACC=CAM_ASM_000453 /LENGTH=171 /DNA_ID=CAMNT_0023260975 /DNA_START=34 /DNA_END=549 /DNA_ORIENTATION=-
MAPLSQDAVMVAWITALKDSTVYRKVTPTLAKVAEEGGVLQTIIKGEIETSKRYEKGDYIVQGPLGERYALDTHVFEARYDMTRPRYVADDVLAKEGFLTYLPTGKVWAHELSETDCAQHFSNGAFMASWGEPMAVMPGDYIATPWPAATEVYRVEREAFSKTYAPDVPPQ